MVLGLVIERLSGVPDSGFVQEKILQPLKMQRTTFHQGRLSEAGSNCVKAAVVDPELVTSGDDCKDGATESSVRCFVHAQASSENSEEADVEETHGLPGEAAWQPAGGLLSSASDMQQWLSFLIAHTASEEDASCSDAHFKREALENFETVSDTGEGSYRRLLQEVLKPKVKADWQLIFGVPAPGEAAYPEFTGVEYGLGVQVFSYR
jgi:CubicO group peptidase (beta-lactamase class C family)